MVALECGLRCFALLSSFFSSYFFLFSFSLYPFPLLFLYVFSSPLWSELNQVQDPRLRQLVDKLPEVFFGSRVDNTTLTNLNGFKSWRSWLSCIYSLFFKIPLPVVRFKRPCTATVRRMRFQVESLNRWRLSHGESKMLPVRTQDILLKFFPSLDAFSVDARFMALSLLAFAGFLRFDELSNLKLEDIVSHAAYFELFIESSQADQCHVGAVVPMVKTGTDLRPWANLLKYLSQAKVALPTSPQSGGDGFLS